MRVLGIDYGSKRIGFSISDPFGTTALPLTTIDRTDGWPNFLTQLNGFIAQYTVEHLVIGYPKTLKGEAGPMAENVTKFVERLKKSIQIPTTLWDERLSTAAVERIMIEKGMSREKRKTQVDAEAAAFILQGYLDAQKHAQ